MIIIECEQRSPEWFKEHVGRPSASNFDQIITSKGDPSKSAIKYIRQLAGERITGTKAETYQNAAMHRGIELEPEARLYFELAHKDVEVKQVGLCYPDERKLYLCSPDGLLHGSLEGSGLEIKCPEMQTHVQYLLEKKLPIDYLPQVQGGMLITGFSRWFFMSYYPGLSPLIIEVKRDFDFTAKLKVELDRFCKEIDEVEKKLRSLT